MIELSEALEAAAQAVHETIRAMQIAEHVQPLRHWEDADQWQRDATRESVRAVAAGQTPREQHVLWMDAKIRDGWVRGDVKDPVAKTHPDLVDYDDLDEWSKRKDAALVSIVSAMTGPLPD